MPMFGGSGGSGSGGGIIGPPGPKGDKGDTGAQGLQGIQGIKGDKGDTGAQGLQGIQGIKGDKGDTGAQGLQGVQGIKGDKGDTGAQGLQGVQGIKGDKGDTGGVLPVSWVPKGIWNGVTPYVANDMVVDLTYGASYVALLPNINQSPPDPNGANKGVSTYWQIISLHGTKGDKGADGAQGIQGIKGDKGDKGDTGAQGIQGIQGTQGIPGQTGLGIPTGGTPGQVIRKKSAANYDVEWGDKAGLSGMYGGEFATKADLISYTTPEVGLSYVVTADESQSGKRTYYLYQGVTLGYKYIGTFSDNMVADGSVLSYSRQWSSSTNIAVGQEKTLGIPYTSTFATAPPSVMKYETGADNVVTTVTEYENGNASSFRYDSNYVDFLGLGAGAGSKVQLKTAYTDVVPGTALGTGKFYTGAAQDQSTFKSITSLTMPSISGSNIVSGGTMSADTTYTTYAASNLLDNDPDTYWRSDSGDTHYLIRAFTTATTAEAVEIGDDYNNLVPTVYSLEGSNDGSSWSPILDQFTVDWKNNTTRLVKSVSDERGFRRIVRKTFTAVNYKQYRLRMFNCKAINLGYIFLTAFNLISGPEQYTKVLGATVSADSVYSGNVAAYAYDNNNATFWRTPGADTHWFRFDFSEAKQINAIDIADDINRFAPVSYSLKVSSDGTNWTEATAFTVNWNVINRYEYNPAILPNPPIIRVVRYVLPAELNYRYYKLDMLNCSPINSGYIIISEIALLKSSMINAKTAYRNGSSNTSPLVYFDVSGNIVDTGKTLATITQADFSGIPTQDFSRLPANANKLSNFWAPVVMLDTTPINTVSFAYSKVPKDQFIHANGDIDLKTYRNIDWFHVNDGTTGATTGTGKYRVVASVDSGKTWLAYNGSSWVTVLDTANATDGIVDGSARFIPTDAGITKLNDLGMTKAVFDAAPWNALTLADGKTTIRFGYLLSIGAVTDAAFLDNLKQQVDAGGKWKVAVNGTDYEARIANTNVTIKWLTGGYLTKVNY